MPRGKIVPTDQPHGEERERPQDARASRTMAAKRDLHNLSMRSLSRRRRGVALPRQLTQAIEFPFDQRLLLCPRPALDLPLGGDRVDDALEVVGIDQQDRPARCSVTVEMTRLVLGHTDLEIRPRGADVVRAVGTQKNVEPHTHDCCSPADPYRARVALGSASRNNKNLRKSARNLFVAMVRDARASLVLLTMRPVGGHELPSCLLASSHKKRPHPEERARTLRARVSKDGRKALLSPR